VRGGGGNGRKNSSVRVSKNKRTAHCAGRCVRKEDCCRLVLNSLRRKRFQITSTGRLLLVRMVLYREKEDSCSSSMEQRKDCGVAPAVLLDQQVVSGCHKTPGLPNL
jgi:hypothetical protein